MTKWTKEYDNDTGPYDDYFEEWWNVTDGNHTYRCKNSDDADFLIAALAQPEQKPVAWISPKGNIHFDPWLDSAPLYTTPPQRTWVGLTYKEVQEIHDTYHKRMGPQEFASMIEAKLRSKNEHL